MTIIMMMKKTTEKTIGGRLSGMHGQSKRGTVISYTQYTIGSFEDRKALDIHLETRLGIDPSYCTKRQFRGMPQSFVLEPEDLQDISFIIIMPLQDFLGWSNEWHNEITP